MDPPAPMPVLPTELFPHVARPAVVVDACLSERGVPHPEPSILSLARALLNSSNFQAIVTDGIDDASRPKGQRVWNSWKLLRPKEADMLAPKERVKCVAIASSTDLAAPVPDAHGVREVRVASTKTTVYICKTGESTATVAVGGALPVTVEVSPLLLAQLFDQPAPERLPWSAGCRAAAISGGNAVQLPGRLLEAYATVLQDHLRAHVLLHAALPTRTSRTFAMENMQTFERNPTRTAHRQRAVTASVHASCTPVQNCICNVIQPLCPCRPGGYGVQFKFTFCGATLVDQVCPLHHGTALATDGVFGTRCMLHPKLTLECRHPDGCAQSMVLRIPDAALPALLAIGAAAAELATSEDAALDIVSVHARVEAVLEEAEKQRREKRPVCSPETDRVAVETFRDGERLKPPYAAMFSQSRKKRAR